MRVAGVQVNPPQPPGPLPPGPPPPPSPPPSGPSPGGRQHFTGVGIHEGGTGGWGSPKGGGVVSSISYVAISQQQFCDTGIAEKPTRNGEHCK
ncbi:MAG TPA: hypothetical protein DIT97_05220 [Gimesia maris]|uniref:Uncharacterized protein n=1 Tax=Gimesia maris TaxID=122 RepID=A0A3D3R2P1_9PLAN|nr:hypothetical protein [Gimesia maris]